MNRPGAAAVVNPDCDLHALMRAVFGQAPVPPQGQKTCCCGVIPI